MSRPLTIVVTCTNRKSVLPAPVLQVRTLRSPKVETRAAEWSERIADFTGQRTPVRDLYCGEQWQHAMHIAIRAAGRGWTPEVYVASAGLGLLSIDEAVPSYAATFAPYEEDSVGKSAPELQAWWRRLGNARRAAKLSPVDVADLVSARPDSDYLVVVSGAYLEGLEADLCAAVQYLNDPETLVIVSSGASAKSIIAKHIVSPPAKVQAILGGARQALNVRVGGWLLSELGPERFDVGSAASAVKKLAGEAPELVKFDRKELDDDAVTAFIQAWADTEVAPTASRLLRVLRDRGFACEQKRFGRLFKAYVAGGQHDE
jgi:hypothetical protein